MRNATLLITRYGSLNPRDVQAREHRARFSRTQSAMKRPTSVRKRYAEETLREGFVASAPLLATSAVLFVVAVFALMYGVTFAGGRFPLAGLLAGLGFIAAIGAVLSWFFASGTASEQGPKGSDERERAEPPSERLEGRPRPDVRIDRSGQASHPSSEQAPWDEGPSEPPAPRPARYPTLAVNVDAQDAIQELERIQQEVTSRRLRRLENRT